jgi:hypothetical protein
MEILGIPIPHIIPIPFGPLFPKNVLELKQIVDLSLELRNERQHSKKLKAFNAETFHIS